ncbi:efflux transporter periplasmic adaptor subunit, partial [Neisseria sp. P0009.S004]
MLNSGYTTVLSNILQTYPMYVNVTHSSFEVMKLLQLVAEGNLLAANCAIAVDIKFEDCSVYPEKVRLLFEDPTVNETT